MARAPISAQTVAQLIVNALSNPWRGQAIVDEAVPVVEIVGGVVESRIGFAASRESGRRILRLCYDWHEIEQHVYLDVETFSRDVLPTLTTDGAIIRARMRAERHKGTT